MFDASFLELLIVGVVALLVLGPEKLPGAVKTAGLWIGRLRRSFNNIKRDIEKEIGADEIRRQLRNEAIMEKFDKTKTQFTKTVDSIKKETTAIKDDMNFEKEITGFMGEDENKVNASTDTKPEGSANEVVENLISTPKTTTEIPSSNGNDKGASKAQPDNAPAKQEENK